MSQRSSGGDALVGGHAPPAVADRRCRCGRRCAPWPCSRDRRCGSTPTKGPCDRSPVMLHRPVAQPVGTVAGDAVGLEQRLPFSSDARRRRGAGSSSVLPPRRSVELGVVRLAAGDRNGSLGRREALQLPLDARRSSKAWTAAATSSAGTSRSTTAPSTRRSRSAAGRPAGRRFGARGWPTTRQG